MKPSSLLTTKDNPHNPHTHWEEWYAYDVSAGHNTCSLLARVANASESINDGETELAMLDIIRYTKHVEYVLVTKENFDAVMKA